MPSYTAPVRDVLFLLDEVLDFQSHAELPGFGEATPDLIEAILGEAAKFCEEALTPLNAVGDREGCTRSDDASVTTPKGFREAYATYRDNGWIALSMPEAYGGQGLPLRAAARAPFGGGRPPTAYAGPTRSSRRT